MGWVCAKRVCERIVASHPYPMAQNSPEKEMTRHILASFLMQLHSVRNSILLMRKPPSFRSGASPIFPCPWWASPRCRAYSHTSRFRGWWSGSCRAPRQELVGDPLLVCLFLRANTGISTRTLSKARYNESIQDATSWRLLALPRRSGELMETFKSPYPFLQPIPIWR